LPDAASTVEANEARAHLVLDDAAATAELAQAVEVPEQRHVGIRRVVPVAASAFLLVDARGCGHQREVGAEEDDLEAAPLRGDAEVEAPVARARPGVVEGLDGNRLREERITDIRPWRREDVDIAPREERVDLLLRAPHGGR
jgi:hypothetical protein